MAEEEITESQIKRAKQVIEAALFMAPGIMEIGEIARIGKIPIPEARVLVNQLMHDYWERESAIEIRDEGGGLRMTVKHEFLDDVESLSSPEVHAGATKTLAYIAYKQPVRQSDVIRYRNTKAYDHIILLEEKGFIRREKTKNSYVIYTTKKFKDYFGSIKPGEQGKQELKKIGKTEGAAQQ